MVVRPRKALVFRFKNRIKSIRRVLVFDFGEKGPVAYSDKWWHEKVIPCERTSDFRIDTIGPPHILASSLFVKTGASTQQLLAFHYQL